MLKKLDFITPTTLKVLELFFDNSAEEFHEREVMRRCAVSKGSANKILRKLSGLDFLMRAERGRMVFYRINMKNAAVRQLKIFYNTWKMKELADEMKKISRKVVLFGSCAEGTDVEESDIDIFVITDEKEPVREIIGNFNKKIKGKISPVILDVNEYIKLKREDKPFYERVDRGIVLWERE